MKKIISVSYYADFSRYFHYLHKNISMYEVQWTNLCLHHSAYTYDLVKNINTLLLPYEVRKKKYKNLSAISTSNIEDIIGLFNYQKNKKNIFSNIANLYLYFFEFYLKKHNPDLVIISGDERIPTKILSYVAHKLNIRVLYFEQGPFGTTILDEIGVNANCSFRGNSNQESSDKKKLMQILEKKEKWLGYKKYRVLDIIHQVLFPSKYPEITKYKLSLAKKNKHPFSVWKTEKNIILLVLQVPEDVNMVCHSPYFENHYDIVKYVYSSIPVGYKLVVREHPLYKNKYESELYDFIAKNNIMIDSAGSLKEKIQKSSLVIVNNSTVGLEAMTYNKSIIVLGNSYYDNPEFTYKFNGENLHDLIITAIVNPKDSNSINQRLNYLFNNQFLSGHFRDKDLSDLKGHVEKICEHLI